MATVQTPSDSSGPAPAVLEGRGLRLRLWDPDRAEDVDTYLRGVSDPEFRRWNVPAQPATTRAQARAVLVARRHHFDRGTAAAFCVIDAGAGTIVGHLGINAIDRSQRLARVGYWVLPEARGRHVATRALLLGSAWAFGSLGLHRLELDHAVGHTVSCRVAERGGFRYEGTMRGRLFADSCRRALRDAHLHARLATDPEPPDRPARD